MKNKLWIGIVFIVLGALIAAGPSTIFPVCSGGMKMSCQDTAQAELWTGAAIVLLGAFKLIVTGVPFGLWSSIGLGIAGILALLFPTVIIRVCGGAHMTCRTLTLPALIILSIAVIALDQCRTLPTFAFSAIR